MSLAYQAILAIAQANIRPTEELLSPQAAAAKLNISEAALQERTRESLVLHVAAEDAEPQYPLEYLESLKRYLSLYQEKYHDISELYRLHLIEYAYSQSSTQATQDTVLVACKEMVESGLFMTNPQVLDALNMPAWKLNRWVLKGLIAHMKVGYFRYYSSKLIVELSYTAQLTSAKKAAKYLGISPRELFEIDANGALASTRDSSGIRHYHESDLKAYQDKLSRNKELRSSGLGTTEAADELGISATSLTNYTNAGLIKATKIRENLILYDRAEINWAKEGLNTYVTEPEFEWLEAYLADSHPECTSLQLKQVTRLLGVHKEAISDWREDGLLPSRVPVLLLSLQKPPRLYADVYFSRLKLYAGNRPINRSLVEKFRDECASRGCIVAGGMRYVINPEFEWLEAYFIDTEVKVAYLSYGQVRALLGISGGALFGWRQKELIPYYKTDPLTTFRKQPALWYPGVYFEQLLKAANGQKITQKLLIEFRNQCAKLGRLPST